MADVARAWSGVLGWTITPKQVALLLATLKLVREGHLAKPDNLVDCHGYLLIAEKIDQAGWKTVHAVPTAGEDSA